MANTYKAILYGDKVVWLDGPPQQSGPVEIRITIVDGEASEAKPDRGRTMADVLAELARRRSFEAISDPVAWQRKQRQDRTLAHRGP